MSSSVVVLAAGRGTRFGGMKQLAEVGADGETIIDILLQRAAAAGIERAVIVVSPDGREPVVAHLAARGAGLPVDLALQAQPRGTADALLAARTAVDGSCVVVNADDVYPHDAFVLLAAHLRDAPARDHAMVAFRVGQTLIGNRPEWRARIDVDQAESLVAVHEGLVVQHADGLQFEIGTSAQAMSRDERVSMNMWAFRASVFDALADAVARFEAEGSNGEVWLPDVVAAMIAAGETVRVLDSEEICVGLTRREDVAAVRRLLS